MQMNREAVQPAAQNPEPVQLEPVASGSAAGTDAGADYNVKPPTASHQVTTLPIECEVALVDTVQTTAEGNGLVTTSGSSTGQDMIVCCQDDPAIAGQPHAPLRVTAMWSPQEGAPGVDGHCSLCGGHPSKANPIWYPRSLRAAQERWCILRPVFLAW